MTRFELLVVVKIQLGDRSLLRRCLAVEAAMEALATVAQAEGHAVPASDWALLGLGAGIDLKFAAQNPEQAGAMAEELLVTEGFTLPMAAAVRAARQDPVDVLSADACALAAAWGLAEAALAEADAHAHDLDAVAPARLLARLDDRGTRALAAMELDPTTVAAAALARMLEHREDLGR